MIRQIISRIAKDFERGLKPLGGPYSQIAFALTLIIFLSLPIFLAVFDLPSRLSLYLSIPVETGPYSFIGNEIFKTKSDIDVLLLGASLTLSGLDIPIVESGLEKKLGRQAVVLKFGFNSRNEDILFTILKDVLDHRKVNLLLLEMPELDCPHDEPHFNSFRLMDLDQVFVRTASAPDPLRFFQRLALGASFVLSGPRRVLSCIRPDLISPSSVEEMNGSHRLGYKGEPFVERDLTAPIIPVKDMLIQPNDTESFRSQMIPLTSYERHFMLLAKELIQQLRVPTAIINYPLNHDVREVKQTLQTDWRKELDWPIPIVGVAPGLLFKNIPPGKSLPFYDDAHLNLNGSRLFTKTILPALLEVYGH